MSNSARLQLGFFTAIKTIMLAKCAMLKVDVCALAMIRVVMLPMRLLNWCGDWSWLKVGEIAWGLDDGSRMVLKAEKQEATSEQD